MGGVRLAPSSSRGSHRVRSTNARCGQRRVVRGALGGVLQNGVCLGDALEERFGRGPNRVARRLVRMKLESERLIRLRDVGFRRPRVQPEHRVVLAARATVLHLALGLAKFERAILSHVRFELLEILHRLRPVSHG